MTPLTGIDAFFLYAEAPEMPMHVGCVNLLDVAADRQLTFFDDLGWHIERRMHLVPLFQRKLAHVALDLVNPVWVHDNDVDLDYHLRRVRLTQPGTRAQLAEQVARLHEVRLDRGRPLWQFHLIEGLEDGGMALYSKIHHAALDGEAGLRLAHALLDSTPMPHAPRPAADGVRLAPPSRLAVTTAALNNTVAQYLHMIGSLPSGVRTLGKLIFPAQQKAGGRRNGRVDWVAAPRTPYNCMISAARSYATVSLPLPRVKRVAAACGATVNDVVLALCAGALRQSLAGSGGLPLQPLIAAVPYSLRAAGNDDMGNQLSVMLASLATDIDDPLQRLLVIKASSGRAKQVMGEIKSAMPLDFPSLFAPWLISGLAQAYSRGLAERLPLVANLVVSNIRGAAASLYLCGAEVRSFYPVSIPFHGHGVNISVQSYRDSLDVGVTACRRALPDAARLADRLGDALDELEVSIASDHAVPPDQGRPVRAAKTRTHHAVDEAATTVRKRTKRRPPQASENTEIE